MFFGLVSAAVSDFGEDSRFHRIWNATSELRMTAAEDCYVNKMRSKRVQLSNVNKEKTLILKRHWFNDLVPSKVVGNLQKVYKSSQLQ